MNKLILCTALIIISLQARLCAQEEEMSYTARQMNKSKTDATFNINEGFVNIRDFVTLKQGKLILELSDVKDYECFRNLDSLLAVFSKDIAFYKDSISACPTCHVRIDYVINPDYSFRKIRFKKYSPDGSIFMTQGNEVSRLKFEQDTINIIVQRLKPGIGRKGHAPCNVPYSVRATFLLGNYYSISEIVADKQLGAIMDTLEKSSQSAKRSKLPYSNPLTIVYNPYFSGEGSFKKYNIILSNEYDYSKAARHSGEMISFDATFGVGLIRNTFCPTADVGIAYVKYISGTARDRNIFRLSASPYYFFTTDEKGNHIVNDNWFVNAEIGSIYSKANMGWFGKQCTFAAGYLVARKGGYFKNNTFKIFTNLQITPWIKVAPELIFTNDLKQIFPGVTIKVF